MNRIGLTLTTLMFAALAAGAQTPSKSKPAAAETKPQIAIFAGMAKDAPAKLQKQAVAYTGDVSHKLSRDRTVALVPEATIKKLSDAFAVKGCCGSMDELRKAIADLPPSCTMVMVVAMKGTEGSVVPAFTVARRNDLQGLQASLDSPTKNPELSDIDVVLVREVIDAVAGKKTKKTNLSQTPLGEIRQFP